MNTIPYTITEHDEAVNRCLLVQAKVERQMRGIHDPPVANHAPLRSIEVERARARFFGLLASYRRNHPTPPLTLDNGGGLPLGSSSEPAPGATSQPLTTEQNP